MTWSLAHMPDLTGRTAVITGPSLGGLGYVTARELARAGAPVILAGRTWGRLDESEAALRREVPGARTEKVALDLADLQAVRAGAEAIGDAAYELGGPLRLLVNNAGVMATPRQETVDGYDLQLATNHVGPFLLTGLLLPLLAETAGPTPSRVVTVSSLMHHRTGVAPGRFVAPEGRYAAWDVYAKSKLANLLFTYELDRRLRAAGLPVQAMAAHPGISATHLVGNGPARRWGRVSPIAQRAANVVFQPAEAGAEPTLMAATADVDGGTYVGPGKRFETAGAPRQVRASRLARDRAAQEMLWRVSEQATGLTYP